MKKVLCFGIFLMTTLSFSQRQEEVDSIGRIIQNHNKVDTTYVNLRINYLAKKIYLNPSDTTLLGYNLKTLEIAKKLNYKKGKVLAYNNLGVLYQYILSDPYKAIDNYHNVLELAEGDNSFKKNYYATMGNIGNIYYEQLEYQKALKSYRKIIMHNPNDYSTLSCLGNTFQKINQQDSSIFYYKKAIALGKNTGDQIFMANTKSNLSLVLSEAGMLEEALTNTTESLSLVEQYNLEFIRVPVYLNTAMVYLANSDYEKAEDYSQKALKLNESLNNLYTENAIWGTLADIYNEKKQFEKAIEAYFKYASSKDSISSFDRKLEISRKEIQFEADKEALLAKEEIRRQKIIKNSSLLGGGFIMFASAIGFILYKRRRETQFKLKVADTELKALRAQMNPHFIFNSLNSISSYILNNKTNEANNYLTKFSVLMRKTLESSEKESISLDEDIQLLKAYMDIENKRLVNGFKYDIKIAENLNLENTLVPPMILQPFVENSIWHGISQLHENEKGEILIEVIKEGTMIIYVVEDNGIGREKSKALKSSKHKSLGIKITKNRIDILNKKKNSNAGIKIMDKEKGTRVEVKLPLELIFKND